MTPFACPVCAGRGAMPHGFYSRATAGTDCTPEACRSCGGAGVLWGTAPSPRPTPRLDMRWPPKPSEVGDRLVTYGYEHVGERDLTVTLDGQTVTLHGSPHTPRADWRKQSPLMREASNGCYCDACMRADELAEREGR